MAKVIRPKGTSFIFLLLPLLVLPWAAPSFAWHENTHHLINEAALQALPTDFPSFLEEEQSWIVYQAQEPDRWKSKEAETLKKDSSPEHFLYLESIPLSASQFPQDRFSYMRALPKKDPPEEVGLLPFAIMDTYQKLFLSFKAWHKNHTGDKRKAIEQNIAYYAGLLGHYVGDGSMPLHLTIHQDGWKGKNPNGYSTSNMHASMERYAQDTLRLKDLRSELKPPTLLQDPFQDLMEYLFASHAQVETLYALDKAGAFQEKPIDLQGKAFMLQAVARGSQMLLDLWYTAYIESKKE